MSEPYLLLWLEGPLQAWGHDSKFGRRDSLDFPTKSGVLGLLCCARGARGNQNEWLAKWAERDMAVMAFALQGDNGAVANRQPLMRDFQMVGSAYDTSNPWQDLMIPKKADGRRAVGGGTKMTYRYYVQDMAYAVALQGPEAELESLQRALNAPVWDLYLGRKNCVPTELIGQDIWSDLDEAFRRADELASSVHRQNPRIPIFRVLQGEHQGGEVITLNDVPIQFGIEKRYRDRRVTIIKNV